MLRGNGRNSKLFEAVDSSDGRYPTGVKVSYKAFSSDEVKLLKRIPMRLEIERARATDPLADAEAQVMELLEKGQFPGIIWDENLMRCSSADSSNNCPTAPNLNISISSGEIDDGFTYADDADDLANAADMDPSLAVGYVPVNLHVCTYPNNATSPPHYILTQFPTNGEIKPQPFVQGYRAKVHWVVSYQLGRDLSMPLHKVMMLTNGLLITPCTYLLQENSLVWIAMIIRCVNHWLHFRKLLTKKFLRKRKEKK